MFSRLVAQSGLPRGYQVIEIDIDVEGDVDVDGDVDVEGDVDVDVDLVTSS